MTSQKTLTQTLQAQVEFLTRNIEMLKKENEEHEQQINFLKSLYAYNQIKLI